MVFQRPLGYVKAMFTDDILSTCFVLSVWILLTFKSPQARHFDQK